MMLSIIIPVRDRRESLLKCLDSIARETCPAPLEVVVVDDGSRQPFPDLCGPYAQLHLRVVREVPLGIAAARNRGIDEARGDLLLFLDSDCTLEPGCLSHLLAFCSCHPNGFYQLALLGDPRTPVGRMVQLRCVSTMEHLRTADGHINYANTSGFAVSRSRLAEGTLFDTRARRGEDSLILTRLAQFQERPWYVADARIRHAPEMPLSRYVLKSFRVGLLDGFSRQELNRSTPVLMKASGRLNVLRGMWRRARAEKIGSCTAGLVMIAYALERLGRLSYRLCGFAPGRIDLFRLPVDILTETDLVARCLTSAQHRTGLLVTHLTVRTLLQSLRDADVGAVMGRFDICCPQDRGVVLATALCRGRRARKVALPALYRTLFQEMANRGLRVALIGGEEGVSAGMATHLKDVCSGLEVCLCRGACLDGQDTAGLTRALLAAKPHMVVLAMSQPGQERLAWRLSRELTSAVFWCVDGLFDRVARAASDPPARAGTR